VATGDDQHAECQDEPEHDDHRAASTGYHTFPPDCDLWAGIAHAFHYTAASTYHGHYIRLSISPYANSPAQSVRPDEASWRCPIATCGAKGLALRQASPVL